MAMHATEPVRVARQRGVWLNNATELFLPWSISLPPHLRISPDQMPQLAPLVHIMTLNLLYHTTGILLHRPVILGTGDSNQPGPYRSYQSCLRATTAIHDLLIVQSNTFGLSHITYINAYSAYIAATFAVLRSDRECRLEMTCPDAPDKQVSHSFSSY